MEELEQMLAAKAGKSTFRTCVLELPKDTGTDLFEGIFFIRLSSEYFQKTPPPPNQSIIKNGKK